MPNLLASFVETTQSYDGFSVDVDGNIYTTRTFRISSPNRVAIAADPSSITDPVTLQTIPGIGDRINVGGSGGRPVWLYTYRLQSTQLVTDLFCEYTNNPQLISQMRVLNDAAVSKIQSETLQVLSESIPIGVLATSPPISPGPLAVPTWVESSYPAQRKRAMRFLEINVSASSYTTARNSSLAQVGKIHYRDGELARYLGHEIEQVSAYYSRFRYTWEVDYGIDSINFPADLIDTVALPPRVDWGTPWFGNVPASPAVCPPYHRLKYLPAMVSGVPDFTQRPSFIVLPEPFVWTAPGNGYQSLYGI